MAMRNNFDEVPLYIDFLDVHNFFGRPFGLEGGGTLHPMGCFCVYLCVILYVFFSFC